MNYRHITTVAGAIGLCMAVLTPALSAEPRAVIELFTSQGCSSCPAADRLAGELSKDPSLLVMSLPVDYWDYLGWKDTLALRTHGNRERAYATARGDRDVYTPQVVVNGLVPVLGSDKRAIDNAIETTRKSASPLTVPVKVSVQDGKVNVTVSPAGGETRIGEVWLCPITNAAKVAIGRGENSGRTLTYHNVVRRWVKLGTWNGAAQTFSASIADLPNAHFTLQDVDRVAVIVQSGDASKPGVMLGAAAVACCNQTPSN